MVHGGNMGPTWGRQDPDGPNVGPINLAIRVDAIWWVKFFLNAFLVLSLDIFIMINALCW